VLRQPSLGRRQPLQIGVEFLRRRLRHVSGEHGIGMPRGEAATGVGRARLHQHRPSLWAARQVERPGHMVEITAVLIARMRSARA
jgi:hypothetical protein